MAKKKTPKKAKTENNERGKNRVLSSIVLALLPMLCGFYAYQYYMRPEINIIKVDAEYSRETKDNNTRINLSFNIKNDGRSKTKELAIYSTFLNWTVDKSGVKVAPYDFTYTDVPDLIEGKENAFALYKDINSDIFVDYVNMADGLYLLIILRWQSDNFAFWGRTFESHVLLFLKPCMRDNKMIFDVRGVRQKYLTKWFLEKSDKPDVMQTIKDLGASRLLYGDTSRFD